MKNLGLLTGLSKTNLCCPRVKLLKELTPPLPTGCGAQKLVPQKGAIPKSMMELLEFVTVTFTIVPATLTVPLKTPPLKEFQTTYLKPDGFKLLLKVKSVHLFSSVSKIPSLSSSVSQASPCPSPSVSSWLGFATEGQLSCPSGIPSPSVSTIVIAKVNGAEVALRKLLSEFKTATT